jgi:hypothetical protein
MKKISNLKKQYSQHSGTSLKDIYYKYLKHKEQTLIDAISAATAIHSIFMADFIDFSKISPEMEEAFRLCYPNMDITQLGNYTSEELSGIISNWKGKLFEINVRDNLNAGEMVGEIQLEEGQYATLAEDLNQPGWDLQILNADGTIAQELQTKATNSLGYINEAFEKYPDIGIIATSEVATSNGHLFDSGITNNQLTTTLTDPTAELFDSAAENLLESILPGLPLLIITASEGRKVFIGRQTFNEGANMFMDRSLKTGVSIAAGSALFYLFDSGIISVPATFLVRFGWDTINTNRKTMKILEKDLRRVYKIAPHYNN